MATLQEIRAKLQAAQQTTGSQAGGDNQIFAHWNIAEGATATLRFLPDADPNNTFFWIERSVIKLPFAGIAGETDSKPTTVQVPCMEMWDETCPVLTEVRPWFKDKNLEAMGRTYWKKKSYLFQGFVVDSKLQEDTVPENPIRRFILSNQIFNIVKNALLDPEIEELPTDIVRGLDFKILKATKGGYADYGTSTWARRERALSEAENAAIAQHGLFDLKSFLPKKPGPDELQAIKEMFEASVDGEPYDMERWGKFFKPVGFKGARSDDAKRNASPAPHPQAQKEDITLVQTPAKQPMDYSSIDDDEVPFDGGVRVSAPAPTKTASSPAPSTSDAGSRAADIIALIRNRQKQ